MKERWKGEKQNPPLFVRQGVDDCVLVYPPEYRKSSDPPLRVFSDPTSAGTYTEQSPDPQGFFLLRSIEVRIGVEVTSDGGEAIVLLDARSGQRLWDAKEAIQRAGQAEQGRLKAEAEKLQEAEARQKAEKLNQEMMAELERLRAQLHQQDEGENS